MAIGELRQSEAYAVTTRGGVIENKHKVHVAVVGSEGDILYHAGDVGRLTFMRSVFKPIQALAILESGAFEKFKFDDADLALMCASHSSESKHVNRARSILERIGASEKDLCCGGHPAISEAVNRQWIKEDFVPTPSCSNCSGKHAGMLAGSLAIGAGIQDYQDLEHPLQIRVRLALENVSGCDPRKISWAIDGCNLPTPALPLHYIGKMYAMLARAANLQSYDPALPGRKGKLARIFNAMNRHPELVGGEGRFCTELMQAFPGILIGKVGADGAYGIGIRRTQYTQGITPDSAIGIAVKVEDGNIEILYSVVAEILEQLRIGSSETRRSLERFHRVERRNTVGVVTGGVSHLFKLRYANVLSLTAHGNKVQALTSNAF
ncbi:MAG: hypothetical protein M1820_008210 [Bogoriella megaspora]|nr:MAG: hypothetical protein M1820_008210 [Bogoriella megaspora]